MSRSPGPPPRPRLYADVAASRYTDQGDWRSETRPSQTTNQRQDHVTHPRRAHSNSYDYGHDNTMFSEPWYAHSTYRGCFNCGEMNHKQQNCYFETKIRCHTCKKFGHKAKYCDYEIKY